MNQIWEKTLSLNPETGKRTNVRFEERREMSFEECEKYIWRLFMIPFFITQYFTLSILYLITTIHHINLSSLVWSILKIKKHLRINIPSLHVRLEWGTSETQRETLIKTWVDDITRNHFSSLLNIFKVDPLNILLSKLFQSHFVIMITIFVNTGLRRNLFMKEIGTCWRHSS